MGEFPGIFLFAILKQYEDTATQDQRNFVSPWVNNVVHTLLILFLLLWELSREKQMLKPLVTKNIDLFNIGTRLVANTVCTISHEFENQEGSQKQTSK